MRFSVEQEISLRRPVRGLVRAPSLLLFSLSSSGCALLFELDERLCGNAESLVQTPDHFERQRTPAVEYLVHAIAATDERDEIARLKPILLHVIFDRFYRVCVLRPGFETPV
jgi:hypothetical protein